jgi:hypothetical protein
MGVGSRKAEIFVSKANVRMGSREIMRGAQRPFARVCTACWLIVKQNKKRKTPLYYNTYLPLPLCVFNSVFLRLVPSSYHRGSYHELSYVW